MNKQELIRELARNAEVSNRQATVMLDSALEIIMDTVAAGDKLQLVGFGTFESRERAARTGHNPATGEVLEVPAATVPVFRPGALFKERVDR